MKFANLLTKFYFQPWAIRPDQHAAMGRALQAYLESPKAFMPDEGGSSDDDDTSSLLSVHNGVAVITIDGPLGKRLSWFERTCVGGCDYDDISAAVSQAAADDNVRALVLDINSPGGMMTGLPECAALLARVEKPTYAWTEVQACSAAYWLAASCDEIHCTPSADLGSVGVYIAAVDTSREWEMSGWKLELFRAGKLKAIGLDGKAFTDDERSYLQSIVDKSAIAFRSAVTSRRPRVADSTMEGQWFRGDDSLALGLADSVTEQFEHLLAAVMATA
jgi:signal peptide peptidase SppA